MTIYAGSKWESISTTLVYGNPALGDFPNTRDYLNAGLVAAVDDSLKSSMQPVQENQTRRTGNTGPMFGFLDFFNKIHIQYSLLDLGNIVSTSAISFTVFSSYFEPRTLNDVVETNADGLILTEPESTPLSLQPWQQLEYSLNISAEGPPSVDALYTFEFDVGDFFLRVIGTRLVLFYFEPDGEVVETLEWATDILEAYDGTEQRITLRSAPRQRIEFEILTEGKHDTRLRGLLFDWLPRVFGLPIWWEMRRVTAPVTASGSVINVSTLYGDFRDDGLVMIYQDQDTFEVVGIASMTDTQITLDVNLINSYTGKAVVMPVRSVYASTQPSRRKFPTNVARTQVAFTTIENIKYADTTGAVTYGGKVVLDDANYIDELGVEGFDRPITVIDNASGKLFQYSRTDRSRMRPRKRWQVQTMADLWRVRRLLHHFDGNRISFWLPSWRNDLIVTQTIAGESLTIRIEHCNFTSMFQQRTPFGDVRLTLVDGAAFDRHIADSSVDGEEEVLTINAPFRSTAILVAEIERLELLSLVRITDDRAKFTHRRAGTATIDVNLVSVKE